MAGTRELETEAERLIRYAATDRLPVDAGVVGQMMHIIHDAWQEGYDQAVREVVDAYKLFIDTDDLDGFRDAITEMMPPGAAAEEAERP